MKDLTVPATERPIRHRHWWLLRLLAGIAFGFGCNGAVQFCWLGLLVVVYGSLDSALRDMRPTATMQPAFAAYFASLPASFLAGLLAPLVLGQGARSRRAIVLSAVVGAALATVTALVLGALAGWLRANGKNEKMPVILAVFVIFSVRSKRASCTALDGLLVGRLGSRGAGWHWWRLARWSASKASRTSGCT